MVRRLCLSVILLAALLVVGSGVQAQVTPRWHPQGTLFERADGTYGYIVSPLDRVGQWQVAFGDPALWSELVAANPQLEDPDVIKPGWELNVPPSLVKLFRIIAEVDATTAQAPPITGIGSTDPAPAQVEVTESSHFPYWLVWLLFVALIAFLAYRYARSRERTASDRYYGHRERELRERVGDAERRERARVLADPYAGPPIVEGGLPTPEAAMEHFARTYQEERNRTTVGQAAQLPARVNVDRIVPVWVWGEMGVRQGGSSTPVQKVLDRREPAWRAYLSDGNSRITLWRCGNDVYAGNGYDILPETQIEERTDLPSYTPAVPQQIWPEIAPSNVPAEVPVEIAPLEFTSVKFDGPQRLVLQPGGQVLDFGHLIARGVHISVSVQNGEVIIDNNGQRVVYGKVVGDQPATTVALPAETGIAGSDGSSATSASGASREQKVTEILAAAGESRS